MPPLHPTLCLALHTHIQKDFTQLPFWATSSWNPSSLPSKQKQWRNQTGLRMARLTEPWGWLGLWCLPSCSAASTAQHPWEPQWENPENSSRVCNSHELCYSCVNIIPSENCRCCSAFGLCCRKREWSPKNGFCSWSLLSQQGYWKYLKFGALCFLPNGTKL